MSHDNHDDRHEDLFYMCEGMLHAALKHLDSEGKCVTCGTVAFATAAMKVYFEVLFTSDDISNEEVNELMNEVFLKVAEESRDMVINKYMPDA